MPAQSSQVVYDINVSAVQATVIYAHVIDSGHIQARQIIYGTSYGSSAGQSVNGQSFVATGQLVAHDIHAGFVIADTIYVDRINR